MARCNPKPLRWRNVLGAVSFLICAWTIFQYAILLRDSFVDRNLIVKTSHQLESKSGMLATLRYWRGGIGFVWDSKYDTAGGFSGDDWALPSPMIEELVWASGSCCVNRPMPPWERPIDFAGMLISYRDYGGSNTVSRYGLRLKIPAWIIITASGLISVRLIRLRRSDESVNCCKHCGYDLRATPNRCPECGHYATPSPASPWERAG